MNRRSLVMVAGALSLIVCCLAEAKSTMVNFPQVSPCRTLTTGPQEHLFASYYGINQWDASQRYVTVLETDVKDRIPTENDAATLALVDVRTKELIPLTQTRAWNLNCNRYHNG